ncbi:M20 family metallo-hydrolase [Bacillus sp. R1-10]
MKAWIDQHLKELNLVDTMNQVDGFTRLGYTSEENKSIAVFEKIALGLGLQVRQDEAGNVIARWAGSSDELPAVAVGSHLDTVAMGGGYDGTAGVLCALGAIKSLKDSEFSPVHPIEVINFRSEESSRFGISTIGSKAMAGLLDLQIGNVEDSEGVTIQEAVEALGFNWEQFLQANRPKSELKSFVELHIEQGTIIEDNNKAYGVVQGVACPIRLKVKVTGKAGHTGTTPMTKRNDALVAIAPLIPFVSETAKQLSEEYPLPVVATVSTIEAKPNAMNVIPSLVEVGIDIRSVDDSLKQKVEQHIHEKCAELEKLYHVTIQIETLVNNPSILLDENLQEKLAATGEKIGYVSLQMDSGAGHDVMNMAQKWPSGLLFIPCKEGLSHHPDEFATLDDLQMGVELLTSYLMLEAGALNGNSSRGSRT